MAVSCSVEYWRLSRLCCDVRKAQSSVWHHECHLAAEAVGRGRQS